MKRLMPYTTSGLIIAVVIVGVLASQLAAVALHYDNRRETFAVLEAVRIGDRIIAIARSIAAVPQPQRPQHSESLSRPVLAVSWGSASVLAPDHPRDLKSQLMEDVLRQRMDEAEVHELRVVHMAKATPEQFDGELVEGRTEPEPDPAEMLVETISRDRTSQPFYLIALQLADGSWVNFAAPDTETVPMWPAGTMAVLGAIVLVVISVMAWSIRRLTSPLHALMQAAQRLGVDVTAPPVPESGPMDGRRAIRAFNEMQQRIRRFVEDRTRMLAAISHDLRTPITRLRLRAEFIDDPDEQRKMLSDLDQMETMIQSALGFFRGEARTEPRQECDLAEMIHSVCENRPAVQVRIAGSEPLPCLNGQPVALRRALTNVIDNALKYGGCADILAAREGGSIVIRVDDSGPGIPADYLEEVFRPFYRLEQSRSRDTGGTGLGLSIARAICRAHGGDVLLFNRPDGGLRAVLTLPVAAAGGRC